MISSKSYARVTLALDILRRLPNDYHEIDTVKHKIDLHDEISVRESDAMEIICDNKEIPADSRNIAWKITEIVKKKYNIKSNVSITIKKSIPPQSGLAGGSSNAATTLNLLNRLWHLELSLKEKAEVGRMAGMDVPFFFFNGAVFDKETTNMINPIGPSIRDAFAVVVMPDFSISTSEAYKLVNYARIGRDRGKTYKLMCSTLGEGFRGIVENMHNDFETFMLDAKPELLKIKQAMLESGAENAIMSGSGSSLFSLAENRKQAEGIKSSIDEKKLGKAFLCRTVN